jgi:hypothetical protein
MSCPATVILSEDSLRVRHLRNPWKTPVHVTQEMEHLAAELIQDNFETLGFIAEIEGPTKEEWNDWWENGVKSPAVDPKWFCF